MMDLKCDIVFYERCLAMLPVHYVSADTNRMTLAYFCLSALDLLGGLDKISAEKKKEHIDWVYAQMVSVERPGHDDSGKMGFRGSPFAGAKYDPIGPQSPVDDYDTGHLAMTYTALLILLILGDDLARVDRESIILSIKLLQTEQGSFTPCSLSSEADMRFLFCACAVSYILNDWRGIDKDRAVSYIKKSMGYSGGFGQGPMLEAHGGSTFCAVAALHLMGRIDALTEEEVKVNQLWCLQRQHRGFQGRVDKVPDTCYSFWIGGALKLLNGYDHVDRDSLFEFLKSTRTKFGGFSKVEGAAYPDTLHAYMGLAGLCIAEYPDLPSLHVALNISGKTHQFMQEHSVFWKKASH